MIQQTKTIYYCEHCLPGKRKMYLSKKACERHELECVRNPIRFCKLCGEHQNVGDSLALAGRYVEGVRARIPLDKFRAMQVPSKFPWSDHRWVDHDTRPLEEVASDQWLECVDKDRFFDRLLRSFEDECPACILSVLVQLKITGLFYIDRFDYKALVNEWLAQDVPEYSYYE